MIILKTQEGGRLELKEEQQNSPITLQMKGKDVVNVAVNTGPITTSDPNIQSHPEKDDNQ